MKVYAEHHGLNLQRFYFWKGRLKKSGLVDTKQERPTPRLAAILRLDCPAACSRKASLIFLIGNLFIGPPPPSKGSDGSPPKDHPTVPIYPVHRVAGCPG